MVVEKSALQILAGRVKEIDAGHYPKDLVQKLCQEGYVKEALGEDMYAGLLELEKISRLCGATGFMMWCQSVCSWYLVNTQNTYLRQNYLPRLLEGEILGGTALSNPMKYYAGFESLKLILKDEGDYVVVEGKLPWVSNLSEGHVFGFIAGNSYVRKMYLATVGQQNVKIVRTPVFAVMEGTGTFAISMNNSRFTNNELLADDADHFVRQIRNGFVLLQNPIGLGILAGLLDLMERCLKENPSSEDYLKDSRENYVAAYEKLRQKMKELCAYCRDEDEESFAEVLSLRLELAETVLNAAMHTLLLTGARGLFLQGELQRRIREAQFFAVLSPSIRHLRKELTRLGRLSPKNTHQIRC
ncbi:MAG: acyl-CoA dehydrogenase family protein [Leptospiraceae bacterium]|nr:acyl-CoA dehydrogenase family protein [Leptospiraceae bacterium]MDW8305758.1 acyl-CoA dehydrogenase family protein [Leptospiraceae bacterium]